MSAENSPQPVDSEQLKIAPQYEFSPVQNALLKDLSSAMKLVSGFSIAAGLLSLGQTIVDLLERLSGGMGLNRLSLNLSPVLYIFMGIWIWGAATSFARIPLSRGHDITNLMDALAELHRAFSLLRRLIWILAGLICLLMILAVAAGAFRG